MKYCLSSLILIFYLSASLLAQEPETIKIGAAYGLSGPAHVWSGQARRGIELAVKEINEDGGIHGRPLEIIFEDTQTSASRSVTVFKKLVTVDRVSAVVGDIFSFCTTPLIPLAEKYQTVLIAPSTFNTLLPSETPYFFTTCPRTESLYRPVRQFFDANKDVKSAVIFCAENGWGHTYRDVWQKVAKEKNVEILDTVCLADFAADFRTEVLKASAKDPDAIITGYGIERVVKRMKEINFEAKILTTSDIIEALHYRGLSLKESSGIYFNDWLAGEDFHSAFEKEYEAKAVLEPQNSYEAIIALARALRSEEKDLLRALKSTRYEGVSGPIDFTRSNAVNYAKGSLMLIKDGQILNLSESK